jgi:hypothetical protein
MRRFLSTCFVILSALTLASCEGPRHADFLPQHDSGATKPAIAIVPTIDRTNCETPWDFGEEITAEMRYQVMDNGQLFLIASQQLNPALDRVANIDLMGNDISYAKQFGPCEFLVVTELLEHKYAPYNSQTMTNVYSTHGHYCEQVLAMKVRIRMIDLRGGSPCVVLQEILESNHMVGPDAEKCDNNRLAWRTANYRGSTLSAAHQRLAQDIVRRIETVAYTTR